MDFKGGLRAFPMKRGRSTCENFLEEKVVTTTCTPFGCVIITNLNSEMATGMNRISLVFLSRLPKQALLMAVPQNMIKMFYTQK